MEREIITTEDGSSSVLWKDKNITYHSKFGAIQESQHIFIHAGLEEWLRRNQKTQISILEVGFGTGLNVVLTAQFIEGQSNIQIEMESLEKFPLSEKEFGQLNYADKTLLQSIHQQDWEMFVPLTSKMRFKKTKIDLVEWQPSQKYDLVYFDAFAPEDQPELWREPIFQKIYNNLNDNAILVTYCCKGIVKRALKAVGFSIEKVPGPPGKREFVRARKEYHLQ